jgi:tetratricopeptide (TPR) repeat protein
MYNIIPLFIILCSLFAIIVIIIRKFSVLAALDVTTIQSEKEAIFKEQIIGNRLKRNIIRYYAKFVNIFKPIGKEVVLFGKKIIEKLLYFKENYNKTATGPVLVGDIEKMLNEADELFADEKYDEAEKRYIEIISLDSQNLEAFRGLGRLYHDKKQHKESRQTFEHILRLLEHEELRQETAASTDGQSDVRKIDNHYLSSIYYELALVCLDSEDMKCAQTNIIRAAEVEPNNPRYLDMKLEISIINKEKAVALDALKKLIEVNPENNKIPEFEERIRAI